ncbi:hypothetical protein BSR29_05505 [Boudabousia liubingyangii]|uniref:DUF2207 domain-containing protein n=1 Tax=Boudabousia liubingyangii TaxID=1921764 RepID=A0A1Q5PLP3_9ACTO|nr:DUF2207 domain-containing protein [Boudabousia liubingyangii]OKL47937.1 hypothetical protein BSR29_05505 [Boudabousia liubingyangii]
MAKKLSVLLLSLVCFFAMSLGAVPQAWARSLEDLTITIEIDEDGNAHFTEKWLVSEDGTGTELYKRLGRLHKNMEITDFKVSADGIPYFEKEKWQPSDRWENKKGQYGIVHDGDATELCWGRGEVGVHTYTMEYTVTNFIVNLKDAQAINWQLLNSNLSAIPTNYQYTIKSPKFGPETVTEIQTFGTRTSNEYQNNEILISPNEPLDSSQYLVVLAKLPKGTFNTKTNLSQTWEETKDEANKISDAPPPRSERSKFVNYLGWFIGFLAPFLAYYSIYYLARFARKKINFKSPAETNARRSKLQEQDLDLENYISKDLPDADQGTMWRLAEFAGDTKLEFTIQKSFLSSYILKWIMEGHVKPGMEETHWLGRTSIPLHLDPMALSHLEESEIKLYELLLDASGDNYLLEDKELQEYCRRHPKEWESAQEGIRALGKQQLDNEYLSREVNYGIFSTSKKTNVLTYAGIKRYQQVIGFKHYLENFTIIDERELIEVGLWKNYLIYAAAFGMAEQVYDQLKRVIPELLVTHQISSTTVSTSRSWSHSAFNGYTSTSSRSGGSSGGGGSFSSGGGGSFGGSSGGGFR